MSQNKSIMPSLLMQAARSAAIADGLMPEAKRKQKLNATKLDQKPASPQQGNILNKAPNGDTAAAALAMLASANGAKSKSSAPLAITRPPQNDGNNNIRKQEIGSGTVHNMTAQTTASNTPSPTLTVTASNLTNSAPSSRVTSNSTATSGMHTMRQLPAPAQQKRRLSSFPAPGPAGNNPASAGSAAHRLAVAHSLPVAPKPNLSASSHIPQSVPAPRSSSGSGGSGGKKKGPPLRRGKWTPEEEAYANRLIMEFKAGLLPLTDGTTLRTFLSKLLNCDPMRISKKFVGSNCIGKQVFRRRTADINRLTTEQIQQSRAELSELERRFLERVAQTNRVKSSGVNNNSNTGNTSTVSSATAVPKMKLDDLENSTGATPPWLRPPNGFKHGTGAATAAASLSSGYNRAALAGRALLQGNNAMSKSNMNSSMNNKPGSAGLLALMELQQRQDRDNMLSQSLGNSASNLLAAAAAAEGKNGGDALAQMSRNVSAAKMAGLASGNSMTNLMLKTGLSRDHLSQLVRDHRNSSNSLSNMMERQSSLDALMSLDFQSLQSIDNLANLIQTGRGNQVPRSGLKNWSSESGNNLPDSVGNSNGNLSNLANARRLQSEGRMENLIRSLSSGNVANRGQANGGSNANFNSLLQSMHNNLGGSSNNLLGSASALNLANMLRVDSSTGLTALRMQDGLAQRNTSVDDFLSLVASGDIPHQDPHMLNVPLQSVLQQQQNNSSAAAQFLAQQQLLAQAAGGGGNSALQRFASLSGLSNNSNSGMPNSNNTALGDRIASLGGLANHNSAASLLSQYASQQGSNSAAALAQHQQQANAMNASVLAAAQENDLKRKYTEETGSSHQGASKR